MPIVTVQGKSFTCERDANLRKVLLKHEISLHNGKSKIINWKDRTRRTLPPHSLDQNRRLACQTKVIGDIEVIKYDGFWGQGVKRMNDE